MEARLGEELHPRPQDLEGYLASLGATQVRVIPDRLAIWLVRRAEDEYQVVVPASPTAQDYNLRVDEALQTLEMATGLARQPLISSILSGPNDLLRIRAHANESVAGLIPIDAGVHLAEESRNMVAAAACAALRPQMSYPSRKPAGVPEYLGRVRLGQTEIGSYILTVYSPLEEPSLVSDENRLFDTTSVPFGRRVTQTLAGALDATRGAVGDIREGRNYDVFMGAVLKGVSANLCQAVATMIEPSAGLDSVDIDLSWGRAVPSDQIAWSTRFSRDDAPVLERAAALLRGESPQTGYLAFGQVVGLQRPEGAVTGIVRVSTLVGEKARIVEITLSGSDYDLAIEAHKRKAHVVCSGDLVKRGRTLWLDDPHDFALNSE
jgi:hypothetical protein